MHRKIANGEPCHLSDVFLFFTLKDNKLLLICAESVYSIYAMEHIIII